MASPSDTITTPTLKFVYKLQFNIGDPAVVPNGPTGSRYLVPILDGSFAGADPDFHGTLVGPSADFTHVHSDGSGITLNAHVILKHHDGAIIYGLIKGKSTRDPNNPANAEIVSAKTFETGDERFKWMNNEVLVGRGRKTGNEITIYYYQTVV